MKELEGLLGCEMGWERKMGELVMEIYPGRAFFELVIETTDIVTTKIDASARPKEAPEYAYARPSSSPFPSKP